MSVLNESQIVGSSGQGSGYDITDSLRFRESANGYLSRTPASAGNKKTWTFSCWVKRGNLTDNRQIIGAQASGTAGVDWTSIQIEPNGRVRLLYEDLAVTSHFQVITKASLRDPSAWYHIVVQLDTTQSSATDRVKFYTNGVRQTDFEFTNSPDLNEESNFNDSVEHLIGYYKFEAQNNYSDFYLAEMNFVDGTALTASDFGETNNNGTWIPKKYLGSYGTNGFYLPMKPTTQATGFNTVLYTGNGGTQSITDVGLTPDLVWVKNRDESSRFNLLTDTVRGATKSLASNLTDAESSTTYSTGLTDFNTDGFSVGSLIDFNGSADKMVAWCWDAGTYNTGNTNVFNGSSQSLSVVGSADMALGTGDCTVECYFKVDSLINYRSIIDNRDAASSSNGFSIDIDANGSIYNYSNGFIVQSPNGTINKGVWYHVAYTRSSGTHRLFVNGEQVATSSTSRDYTNDDIFIGRAPYGGEWFDGQISNVRIVKGTALYTSNFTLGTSNLTAVTNTKLLTCQSTTIVDNSGLSQTIVNEGAVSASTNPLFVTNNNEGSITSTVKANSSAGFSIATYSEPASGTYTVGHGLGTAPRMIIMKPRSAAGENWVVYHEDIGSAATTHGVYLNSTAAKFTTGSNWLTENTTTKFGVTVGQVTPGNTTMVAYSFADVTGYQKIGSYTGNGSATGPTVTTGFRPRLVMAKCTNTAGAWHVWDSARQPNNPNNKRLLWNTDDAEATLAGVNIDFNDNGFQLKTSDGALNGSGDTYIFLAIADTTDAQFNFDASGNKNNWTANNINSNASGESSYDLMSDVPTLTDEDTSNFATLNPNNAGTNSDVTDGNLKIANASSHSTIYPTNMPTTGKYYFECEMAVHAAAGSVGFRTDTNKAESAYAEEANKYFVYLNNSNAYIVSETSNVALGSNLNSGTATFQVAIDFDASEYYFGVNNTWYSSAWATTGNPATGANPTYNLTDGTKMFPFLHTGGLTWTVNFGQQPFTYTPPTGYKKWNTFNLADSTITKGSDYMNNKLWTGNGTNQDIDVGFNPGLMWYRNRTDASGGVWTDIVEGDDLHLQTTNNNVQGSFGDMEFITNGYNVAGNSNLDNQSGKAYVGWNWLAGGTGSSNGDGSITSTVSASTKAGFSVVRYSGNATSGATVGHGLGVAPEVVIGKTLDTAGYDWAVYHSGLSAASKVVYLNLVDGEATSTNKFNGTAPSATVVTLGDHGTNLSGTNNQILYCFAPIEGYSKFDKYTGNGSANGPFIYTGFRPAYVMTKKTNSTSQWAITDTARSTYNVAKETLEPNTTSAESSGTAYQIDILSNGFKLRDADDARNGSGDTYIYMAFAENPFKNSNAR